MQLVLSPQNFFDGEIQQHHSEHKTAFTKLSCNVAPFPSKRYHSCHILEQPCFQANSAIGITFPVSQTLHHTVSKSTHSLRITEGWHSVQVQACPTDLLLLKTASPFSFLPFLF